MSNSPCTPSSSTRKVLGLFFRSQKESSRDIPTPRRSTHNLASSSSRGRTNENIPPRLRINTQMNHSASVPAFMELLDKFPTPPPFPSVTPYSAIFGERPNRPPLPSAEPPRSPFSSNGNLHNLQHNEVRNVQVSRTPPNRPKPPKRRPEDLVLDQNRALNYIPTNSPTTAALNEVPIHEEVPIHDDRPVHSFLSMRNDYDFPSDSPIVTPSSAGFSFEPTGEPVDLDDYPWYLGKTNENDAEMTFLYALSPPAFIAP